MLEELYKNYKECLSKSDHKIFSYLLEHEQESTPSLRKICLIRWESVPRPFHGSGQRLV